MDNLLPALDKVFLKKHPKIASVDELRIFEKNMKIVIVAWDKSSANKKRIISRMVKDGSSFIEILLSQLLDYPVGIHKFLKRNDTFVLNFHLAFYTEAILWIVGIFNRNLYNYKLPLKDWIKNLDACPEWLYVKLSAIAQAKSVNSRVDAFMDSLIAIRKWADSKIRNKELIFEESMPKIEKNLYKKYTNSKWQEIGKKVVSTYRNMSGVKGILIEGSVGRGFEDSYSDIDLWILCSSLPNIKSRSILLNKVRDKEIPAGHSGYLEWLYIEGIFCNIIFFRERDQRRHFDYLLDGKIKVCPWHRVQDPRKWGAEIPAYGLADCKILYDPEGTLKSFQKEAKIYSKKLKKTIFQKEKIYTNLGINQLIKAIKFKDPILFFIGTSAVVTSLFRILSNINEKHIDPIDFKWAVKVLTNLTIKPDNCLKRINSIFLNLSSENIYQKHQEILKLYEDIMNLKTFSS